VLLLVPALVLVVAVAVAGEDEAARAPRISASP